MGNENSVQGVGTQVKTAHEEYDKNNPDHDKVSLENLKYIQNNAQYQSISNFGALFKAGNTQPLELINTNIISGGVTLEPTRFSWDNHGGRFPQVRNIIAQHNGQDVPDKVNPGIKEWEYEPVKNIREGFSNIINAPGKIASELENFLFIAGAGALIIGSSIVYSNFKK